VTPVKTRARAVSGGYVLDGAKSLVPRPPTSELFVVAAELEDRGPALFILEPGTAGISVEPEPATGIRAAATAG
jgi:alkylation response protein AidB-like acyl-CoA dehydrogenase